MGREKLTLEKVKEKFEERGYLLLSTEYINSQTPLEYKCKKHPDVVRKIRMAKFNFGQGCRDCSIERQREASKLPFEKVKQAFEERGYVLLDTEYTNNHTPLRYVCPKHPEKERTITYGSLSHGNGCRDCGIESRKRKLAEQGYPASRAAAERRAIPFSQVIKAFESRGYTVLTKEEDYINTIQPLQFKCPNHPYEVQQRSYNELHNMGYGCKSCGIERRSGENHYLWDPSLTDEERLERRQNKINKLWITAVFEKDDYTCQKCKQRGGSLEAHHKDGYHWCKVRRYDISNGATLCECCHKKFHTEYGYWNNTEEQFEEWVNS